MSKFDNHGFIITQCSRQYHHTNNSGFFNINNELNLPISSGTRQHLVDSDDMEWMNSHTDVELILAAVFHQVLVAANAASFQGFGAQLFIFVGNQMNAKREIFYVSLLSTQIEDTDLWIWYTTTET